MKQTKISMTVTATTAVCPIGETVGEQNILEKRIPVMSCEGACIRGEIARLAANQVSRLSGFARACHGELFSVPHSSMARWVSDAEQVVVIDGCHLRCHGRIVENLAGCGRVSDFNAHARHKKYGDLFEIDSVPEEERKKVAADVANWVAARLKQGGSNVATEDRSIGCDCST